MAYKLHKSDMRNFRTDESLLMNAYPVPFRIIATALLSLFLVVMGLMNLRERTVWTEPWDGVLWIESEGGLEAATVDPDGPGNQASVRAGDRLVRPGQAGLLIRQESLRAGPHFLPLPAVRLVRGDGFPGPCSGGPRQEKRPLQGGGRDLRERAPSAARRRAPASISFSGRPPRHVPVLAGTSSGRGSLFPSTSAHRSERVMRIGKRLLVQFRQFAGPSDFLAVTVR